MNEAVGDVYLLEGGELEVESSSLVTGDRIGTKTRVPVCMLLVETDAGWILIDTGNDPDVIDDPTATWGAPLVAKVLPIMRPENHPYEQLRLAGVDPDDISTVVYSHMHHDHVGGARLFPNSTHVVQRAEYRWAFNPDGFMRDIYLPSDFDYDTLRWRFVDDDCIIAPGVMVITTPGHTPGHQSVVIRRGDGFPTIVYSGDAIYTMKNVLADKPSGINYNTSQAMRAMHRLTALSELLDAVLIPSHDRDFVAACPTAPDPFTAPELRVARFYLDRPTAAGHSLELGGRP